MDLIDSEKHSNRSIKIIFLFLITIAVVSASIILSIVITVCCLLNQNETLSVIEGFSQKFSNGAVSSDQQNCSIIGVDVLKENGSAVDAAIATVVCLSAFNMHSSGIGGGGVMFVHTPNSNISASRRSMQEFNSVIYDYREVVPVKLKGILNETDPSMFAMGGLSIGVPGELAGLYTAWKEHGRLPWKRLLQPTITLLKTGITMHKRLWESSNFMKHFIVTDVGLGSLLFTNGSVKPMYSVIYNPELAKTMEIVAEDPLSFYNGTLAEDIIKDISNAGGLMELEDLKNYKVKIRKAVGLKLDNGLTIWGVPPPFGGLIVQFILNILQGYNFTSENLRSVESSAETYHHIIEAMKFGFSERTRLADPDFVSEELTRELIKNLTSSEFGKTIRDKIPITTKETSYYEPLYDSPKDHGTTHVSIYAPDGSAVSITESINIWFGSGYRSPTTGIIYNNQIDDFSIGNRTNAFLLKPSPVNNIEPNKRPASSMSPMFITEDGKIKMILGASGGTRIISSLASVILNKIWINDTLNKAIVRPRVHHQLTPNKVVIEQAYPIDPAIISLLKEKYKHKFSYTSIPEYSSVQGIWLQGDDIYAKSDPRKYGVSEGF